MNASYRSPINRDVPPARAGEFATLEIGAISVWPPVVLAPMAGVTNAPFRTLCQRFGAGLYVSEMITARALVEGNEKTLRLAGFSPEEKPRSLQLYGVDPYWVGEAVAWLVGEGHVDHLDMNFGCPVRKVTRRGGGAALPLKPRLLRNIVREAVARAGSVPVTLKFRIGIDDALTTFRDTGRIAADEGCAAIALHARTAAQHYDGEARWDAIAELKALVPEIPVLGNGDIWEAEDALRMMRTTGCDGVVVGRGCLGRPWLFRSLDRAFAGLPDDSQPTLGEVAAVMRRHAGLMAQWLGEDKGCREFRKHVSWYLKGFGVGGETRHRLALVSTLAELDDLLATLAHDEPFPTVSVGSPRGRAGSPRRVVLPEGWLAARSGGVVDADAELAVSGG